jgi:hypothetical protein
MPSPPGSNSLAVEDLALARKRIATTIKVFVGGPCIAREWTWKDWRTKSASARLRSRVHRYLESRGHTSVLGEHQAVAQMAEDNFESGSVVITETFISQQCDCVILIPDSPGSFCELGAWAALQGVSEKMLLLMDEQFRQQTSYINPHVVSLATLFQSRVEWINYSKWSQVKPKVDAFLRTYEDRSLIKGILHGR